MIAREKAPRKSRPGPCRSLSLYHVTTCYSAIVTQQSESPPVSRQTKRLGPVVHPTTMASFYYSYQIRRPSQLAPNKRAATMDPLINSERLIQHRRIVRFVVDFVDLVHRRDWTRMRWPQPNEFPRQPPPILPHQQPGGIFITTFGIRSRLVPPSTFILPSTKHTTRALALTKKKEKTPSLNDIRLNHEYNQSIHFIYSLLNQLGM